MMIVTKDRTRTFNVANISTIQIIASDDTFYLMCDASDRYSNKIDSYDNVDKAIYDLNRILDSYRAKTGICYL